MSVYLVYSPTQMRYFNDPDEPPEPFAYVAEVSADSKREAITRAVSCPEFAGWCAECRGDGVPPFKGLKADLITHDEQEGPSW